MSDIKPFEIAVPEPQLARLKQKLDLASFPDELDGAGWDMGAPLSDIKRLAARWRDGFDWREHEARLNRLPQFRTAVPVEGFGDLDIHFVHQNSLVKDAIPLLFIHGWPGSFVEVSKILAPLTEGIEASPRFHVVAPSLPNFGFSTGIGKTGFGLAQYAEVCHGLMSRLGYQEYVTQGGDWGSHISRVIGLRYASCKASHLNMILGGPPSWSREPLSAVQHAVFPYSEREKTGLRNTRDFIKNGTGYQAEQATKPQTLGYGIHDSPVGLLAWVYEKLHDWTDDYPWTDDEVLAWVSIYYFSAAGPASSLRIYYESRHTDPALLTDVGGYVPRVPLGLSYFPKDIYSVPKSWGRVRGPVVFEAEHETGGHFAAWEKPQQLVEDLRAMFGRGGGAFGVVKGKDGYGRETARI
ncbi:MAG: hypothetical protein M1832_004687 [Thelocarpon impressellum]|nr:MAG: hypothetical protein M1832_004687 [Thelocarpon impressellum]